MFNLKFENLYKQRGNDFFEQRVKVYIESDIKSQLFNETSPGLFEIPSSYVGLSDNVSRLDQVFSEDVKIISSYVNIFNSGISSLVYKVIGYLPPEKFKDSIYIPYSKKLMSSVFLISPDIEENLELITYINPSDLKYKKRDLVLPKVIQEYNVYKLPGKYMYTGVDDFNSHDSELLNYISQNQKEPKILQLNKT